MTSRQPTPGALERAVDLRLRVDLILLSIALRTDLSPVKRERLIREAKEREYSLALDDFAQQAVAAAINQRSQSLTLAFEAGARQARNRALEDGYNAAIALLIQADMRTESEWKTCADWLSEQRQRNRALKSKEPTT